MSNPAITVISLGMGVQSVTLAAMSALGNLPPVTAAIHADTTHERQGTYAYAEWFNPWLEAHGVRVLTVSDKSSGAVSDAGDKNILIPAFTLAGKGFSATEYAAVGNAAGGLDSVELTEGQLRRQCTSRWKITPIRQAVRRLLAEQNLDATPGIVEQWIGISQDEFQRARTSDVQYITHRYPLLDKRMTRADCIAYLQAHDLPVPPKSACVFCPYHNRHAWQELKREGGPDWDHAVSIDAAIRDRRPPFPLFVHPARVPLAQAIRIAEDAGYTQGGLFDRAEVEDAPCDNGGCFI